jgi:hypothetical protein
MIGLRPRSIVWKCQAEIGSWLYCSVSTYFQPSKRKEDWFAFSVDFWRTAKDHKKFNVNLKNEEKKFQRHMSLVSPTIDTVFKLI